MKMRYIHAVGYYFCHEKREEKLPLATTWIDPEESVISEISQTQKDRTVRSHLHIESKIVKIIEVKNRMIVARGCGLRGGGKCGGNSPRVQSPS